ncbi:hypothetical protein VNI00_006948 [Paramarasmius palmivorus]|uniref:Uncharacterized protein n=1 Tax=Paramarasmius palmivorus TaxID=297713 RepID=A0AAW0D3X2_9AGAR
MPGIVLRSGIAALGLLWTVLTEVPSVQGQIHAVCSNSTFDWSFNSRGQSPCQIAEALGGVCAANFNIQPLDPGYYYSGFNPRFATECVCNTVYYTLLSVCGECQGGWADQFNLWSENCTTVYTSFPKSIPSGTAVPHYAFLPLDNNENIDLAAIRADTGPEATPTTSATGPDNTGGSTGGSTGSSKKTNVGAIAGGVVGGVVFLALVGGVIAFILWRRSKRNKTPPSQMTGINNNVSQYGSPYTPGAGAATTLPYTPTSPNPPSEKVYNPNDPATFPQPTVPYQQPSPPLSQHYPTSPDRTSNLTPPSPNTHTAPPYSSPYMSNASATYPQAQLVSPVHYSQYDGNNAGVMSPGMQAPAPPQAQAYQPPAAPVRYSGYDAGGNTYGAAPASDPHRQAYTSGVPQI